MENVASNDFCGRWNGLAPMRFEFTNHPVVLMALQPGFKFQVDQPQRAQVEVQAYPKAYLFPTGWVVGMVLEFRGKFLLSETQKMVEDIRSKPLFLYNGKHDTLEEALLDLNDLVRSALLVQNRHAQEAHLEVYTVCSPISFEGQEFFDGRETDLDFPVIRQILGADTTDDGRQVVTHCPATLTISVFNRGTILFTRRRTPKKVQAELAQRISREPACGLSNLKNLLMIAAVMQKFHESAKGYRDSDVRSMRKKVAATFKRLTETWKSTHFKDLIEKDKGHPSFRKMLEPYVPKPIESVLDFLSEHAESLSQQLNASLSFIFGVSCIFFILKQMVHTPNPTLAQWKVFCVVLALAAGGVATMMTGMLRLEMELSRRIAIGATGTFVVFMVVYFFIPAMAR